MAIPLTCDCGRSFRLKDELAGRKVRCPACQEILTVPLPEVETEEEPVDCVVADEPAPAARRRTGIQAEPSPRPARPRRASLPEAVAEKPLPPVERRRPRPPRSFVRDEPRYSRRSGSGSGWGVNAGVGGGLLMVLIAVIWFFGGLLGGIIFFYPPVLFVIGLIAIGKGLTDRG